MGFQGWEGPSSARAEKDATAKPAKRVMLDAAHGHLQRTRQDPAAAQTRAGAGPWWRPTLWALAAAGLLWASFPPLDAAPLAWVALVPLGFLIRGAGAPRRLFAASWLGGLAFWLGGVQWLRYTDAKGYFGWIALALYLSLYFPVFVWLARAAVRLPGVGLTLAMPACWVTCEYLRAHLMTGFPWLLLGHSQYRTLPLIQAADWGGVSAIGALVALVNGWLADCCCALRRRRVASGAAGGPSRRALASGLLLVLASVGGSWAYGRQRLAEARFQPGPRVALLQSNIPQMFKTTWSPERILREYSELLAQAVPQAPDLIIWPETAYPYQAVEIAENVRDAQIERAFAASGAQIDAASIRALGTDVDRELRSLARDCRIPQLIGLGRLSFNARGCTRSNSALLVEPDGRITTYDKMHLVPFGEYLPFRAWLPWLQILTPYKDTEYSLEPGRRATHFRLGASGGRFGTLICFEDSDSDLVRRVLQPQAGAPPGESVGKKALDFLVNLSNDGWFHGSAELDQHLALSVFRAVEARVPLVRCANTGISAIIDGNGRIVRRAAGIGGTKEVRTVLVGRIPLDDRSSLYAQHGDWFAVSLAILTGMGVIGARWKK